VESPAGMERHDDGDNETAAAVADGDARRLSWGIFLLAAGSAAFFSALAISESAFTSKNDIGPRAFPMALSAGLVIGGLVEVVLALRGRPARKSPGDRRGWHDPRLRKVVVLGSVVAAYVTLIPLAGFSLATVAMGTGMTRWLGARWTTGGGFAVALVIAIQLLFGQLFQVQLPAGRLGLPF